MGSLASEYREKINSVGKDIPEEYKRAKESLWEYNKLINPRFFKESRPHLKILAEVLQAIWEHRIIKRNTDRDWQIVSKADKEQLEIDGTEFRCCRCLAIDIPPRHGKSYDLSQFCDWVFGKNQEEKIIAITYNEILAGRFSVNVRDGIEATKVDKKFTVFGDIFPDVHIKYGDSAKQMWSLEGQFFSYLGTGFGGTITGVGCSIGIIDDPIKNHQEAFNDAFLAAQYQWYTDTFLSRLEEDAIQILNMTRWNSGDLVGRVLSDEDGGDWYVLKMRACLDEQTGAMLCPELFSFASYLKRRQRCPLPSLWRTTSRSLWIWSIPCIRISRNMMICQEMMTGMSFWKKSKAIATRRIRVMTSCVISSMVSTAWRHMCWISSLRMKI